MDFDLHLNLTKSDIGQRPLIIIGLRSNVTANEARVSYSL